MKIFGFELNRVSKAAVQATTIPPAALNNGGGGGLFSSMWGVVRESFPGAWQQGITIDDRGTMLAFSAVYACIKLISDDISKLRPKLMALQPSGIWTETTSAAFTPVLKKPNDYQTRIQFLQAWVISKLIYGNTYVLKQRDGRGIVVAMHVLNPRMVRPMVTPNGEVWYGIGADYLSQTTSNTVPASEVIHDRASCLFHPLVGVGPIYACGLTATQGRKIQNDSALFFQNMSRPSGQLTSPHTIEEVTAARLKKQFEEGFSGPNIGRLFVTGDNLKYESMTIPAQQAQLIEQLQWTVEDVARCFLVPLHKIGAQTSTVKFANMAELNQDYYGQTLQGLIEEIELLLNEGLGLAGDGTQTLGVELDLDGLLRLNPLLRAQTNQTGMDAGYLAPDEARLSENREPLPDDAGKYPFMQQQKFPLTVLVKQPAPGSTPPAAPVAPAADPAKAVAEALAAADERFRTHLKAIEYEADQRAAAHAKELAAERAKELADRAKERADRDAAADRHVQAMSDDVKALTDLVRQQIARAEAKAAIPADEEVTDELRDFAAEIISKFTVPTHVD